MKQYSLNEMVKGWFVGGFTPAVATTHEVEVAVKQYKKGDTEELHHHRVATEITVVISGRVRMNGTEYVAGDIIVIEPYEATDFEAVEDSINTVVKLPGILNDKYMGEYAGD